MRAGLINRPSRLRNSGRLGNSGRPGKSSAHPLRTVWNGVLSTLTFVGIVAIWASFSSALLAKTVADTEDQPNLIGSYLAGRFARAEHEPERAAEFYKAALERDRNDDILLEHTFQMELASGRFDRAQELAERLVAIQPNNRMAQTLLALTAFKKHDYERAGAHMKAANENPIGELTSAIGRAWIKTAAGDLQGALDIIDTPKQAEWAQFYLYYHRGLIADIGGRFNEARSAFEKVFKQDNKTLRTALAYAHSAANAGDTTLAKSILKEHLERQQSDGHPLARDLRDKIVAGDRVGLLVKTPADGMAEVFYGLGEALTGEGGVNLGIVYLQLALYVEPNHAFALAALSNTYESLKKFQAANDTYDRIPRGTALQSSIDIRKAFNFNSLDKVDDASALLQSVAKAEPKDLRPLEAIGNIMRARKRYDEAVGAYSKAITLIPKLEKRHWAYFYSRGTCYERLKNWPAAEADLQKALTLFPDQPLVLNYLGYSWIDQGLNLTQGLGLIEKAVSLRPDDGYIVDSLGWAYFKMGDFKEAVKYLERAVELRPDDPTLNDHLGDALWRVGRVTEARFQWDQALTLKPEPEDIGKIKDKLEKGLPAPKTQAKATPVKARQVLNEAVRKRAQATPKGPAKEPALE
ncbi:MAG: tetratricopeptide repeat protein [Hyphomicrobiaceae bacterium]